MSASLTFQPGVYKDRKDLDKQMDAYYIQLEKAKQIQALLRDIDSGSILRTELQLAPEFQKQTEIDKLNQSSKQRAEVFNLLNEIYDTPTAEEIIGKLTAKDEVMLFNRFGQEFIKEYNISNKVNSKIFLTDWEQFLKKKNSSQDSILSDIKQILESSNTSLKDIINEIKKSETPPEEQSKILKEVVDIVKTRKYKEEISKKGVDYQTQALNYLFALESLDDEALIETYTDEFKEDDKNLLEEPISGEKLKAMAYLLTEKEFPRAKLDWNLQRPGKAPQAPKIPKPPEAPVKASSKYQNDAMNYLQNINSLSDSEIIELYSEEFKDDPYNLLEEPISGEKLKAMKIYLAQAEYPRAKFDWNMLMKIPAAPPVPRSPGLFGDSTPEQSPFQRRDTRLLEEDLKSILNTAVTDIKQGNYRAGRQSLERINERDLSPDSRRLYNYTRNVLQTNDEELSNVGEPTGREMSPSTATSPPSYRSREREEKSPVGPRDPRYDFDQSQTIGAVGMAAQFYRIKDEKKSDKAFKRVVTSEFNQVFNTNDLVSIWSDTEHRRVQIKKSNVSKYYQKLEAIILNIYPDANLQDIDIPYKTVGQGFKPKIPKLKSLGRHMIHIPSLQRGYLSIKFPDGSSSKHFKKKAISSIMQNMLWMMIDEKTFDPKMYKQLKSEEQKLFDEILYVSKVPKNEIKELVKHKSTIDKERDECLKKLKILTGSMMAGNDNKKILKQLKVLLLKMIDKKYISKADANRLFYEMAVLDE